MTTSSVSFLVLILSLSSVVLSDTSSFQKLEISSYGIGPEASAFDSTGKVFYTSISGGKILKYSPETGFVKFAVTSQNANGTSCDGVLGAMSVLKCGRPYGLALNEKTGDLYIADAPFGLLVVSKDGGIATKIADSVDGKPFKSVGGLDVDPTTGVVYFTSFTTKFLPTQLLIAVLTKDATGKLYKYDPATKKVTVLVEGLSGAAGCAVSADGSFVLVGEFIKGKIQRYWIKGPKSGKTEDFAIGISHADNIKRVGSTGNFWVASTNNKFVLPTDPIAVKLNSDGKVVQTIPLKDHLGITLFSEANEFNGSLYIGTLLKPYVGVLKL